MVCMGWYGCIPCLLYNARIFSMNVSTRDVHCVWSSPQLPSTSYTLNSSHGTFHPFIYITNHMLNRRFDRNDMHLWSYIITPPHRCCNCEHTWPLLNATRSNASPVYEIPVFIPKSSNVNTTPSNELYFSGKTIFCKLGEVVGGQIYISNCREIK